MCGIAGIVARDDDRAPPSLEQLSAMAGALHHRGPDEAGIYRDRRIGLAHTRLAIVDIQNGQQPLGLDGRWIVFNGEIFNHVQLRRQLEGLGRSFRTRCDTEVILHAYAVWGDDCFRRFNGQWALALWDEPRQRLLLSRDPFGILPLYVAEHGRRLLFASEVKAIFAAEPGMARQLEPAGLDQTFTFWSVVPPQGIFRGIGELEPGCTREFASGRSRVLHQLQPVPLEGEPRFSGGIEEAAEAVRHALQEATRLRLFSSDVPVGSYLSGGLDSALIAALAKAVQPKGFSTFSLRFDDPEFDEGAFQRQMAERIGGEHHELRITAGQIAQALPEVIRQTERPILRTAPVPLFLLSQQVRQAGIKVVLTGEGADELFAGYDLFREAKIRRFWSRQPRSRLRPRLLERLYPYLRRSPVLQRAMAEKFFGRNLHQAQQAGFSHQLRWDTTRALRRLFSPALRNELLTAPTVERLLQSLPEPFGRLSPLSQDQYLEMRTLLAGYLLSSQGDRMLMAHSVEGRFPFLDPEVARLAQSLPDGYKLRILDEKHVLKRMGASLLPGEILRRKKQPYRAPDAAPFLGPGAPDWVLALLSPQAIATAGIFDPLAVGQLVAKLTARRSGDAPSNSDNMALVGVLSTQLLHQLFVEAPPSERRVPLTILEDRLAPGASHGTPRRPASA